MATCIRCGADTRLFVAGQPVCLKCDSELEARKNVAKGPKPQPRESSPGRGTKAERRMVLELYSQATQHYAQAASELARAAGSAEMDAFVLLHERCVQSWQECTQLRETLRQIPN